MLEFYYKYEFKSFKKKAKDLASEVLSVFSSEKIKLKETLEMNIPFEYREILGNDLFNLLNNIFFTIRKNKGDSHPLLKKYLPELKKILIRSYYLRISLVALVD
jgi:hypothetical protein